jgi:hypothetical protein
MQSTAKLWGRLGSGEDREPIRDGWMHVAAGRPPVLFSLYVHDIPTPSRHVELAQYADGTVVRATSGDPSLLVGYLEACLGRLELWLRNWRIAIKVSKSTAVLFAKAARRVQ